MFDFMDVEVLMTLLIILGVLIFFVWCVVNNEFAPGSPYDNTKLFWPWLGISLFCFGAVYLFVSFVLLPVVHGVIDIILALL